MSLDFDVVKTSDLPEKFQPSGESTPVPASVPDPVVDLTERAAAELTENERHAFLARIANRSGEALAESRSREEWRRLLVEWLKEEANRFMAAAVAVRRERGGQRGDEE